MTACLECAVQVQLNSNVANTCVSGRSAIWTCIIVLQEGAMLPHCQLGRLGVHNQEAALTVTRNEAAVT